MSIVTKREVLKNIRSARREHVKWVYRAKKLVNGLEVSKKDIPLKITSCEFGKWFYGDGQILLYIFKEEAIEKLDAKHRELHDIYINIFKIYFNSSKRTLWEKLLGRSKKISATQEQEAIKYLAQLEEVSVELVSYLNIIEKKITLIDEKSFEKFL